MKLTDKQEKFVNEYLVDLNATKAAIRAGYSENSARQIATENLSKPNIQDAIALRQEEIKNSLNITQEEIVKDLRDIKDFDIRDVLTWNVKAVKTGTRLNDDNEVEDVYSYVRVVEMKEPEEVNGKLIKKISMSNNGNLTIETYDKLSAIDKIMNHLGMYEKNSSDGVDWTKSMIIEGLPNDAI